MTPLFSFADTELTTHPGQPVTICVDYNGTSLSNQSRRVQLSGSGQPHLGSFVNHLLTFRPALGIRRTCFDLAIADADVVAEYQFGIQNVSGQRLVVKVEEAPEPVHYCGVIPPSDAQDIGEAPDLYLYSRAFDRFGNIFNSKDLSPFDSPLTGGCGCPEGSGIFELSFEDICTNRNYGFADPTLGDARRNTACRVFSDLSVLLNPTGQIAQGTVRVRFLASEGNGVDEMGENALAVATPVIYSGFPNGITPGFVMRAVQSGQDPYEGMENYDFTLQPGSAHGVVRVNFLNFSFFSSNNPTASAPAGMRDLYTTILHEACHLLGVYSLIDASSSNASLLSSVGSTAAYSKYDTRIRTIGGATNTDNGSPNYIRYPTALPYVAQVAGNSFINQPQCSSNAELFGASLPSQPLYLPFPWNSSGLSHLNCNPSSSDGCATSNGFIMNFCGPAGYNQRHPNQQEVKLLCELGYSLSGTFGTTQFEGTGGHLPWQTYEPCGTGCRAVEVNDVILAEASTNGPPLVVDAATFLSNDVNTTGYVPNSFQMVASNLPVGQITDRGNGLGFSFVPTGQVIGWGVARYLPRCADGSPGDWAYLFIPIVPVGLDELDCPFTVDCNLVCDGDFEASNEALAAAHYDFGYSTGNLGIFVSPDPIRSENNFQFPPAPIIYCDAVYGDFLLPENDNSNIFIGLVSTSSLKESWEFKLRETLEAGRNYRLTYWVNTPCPTRVVCGFSENKACSSATYGLASNVRVPLYEGGTVNCGNDYVYSIGQRVEAMVNGFPTPTWQQVTLDFTATTPGRYLMLYMDNGQDLVYAYFDDVHLSEIPFIPVDISHEINQDPCPGEDFIVSITVCSENPVASDVELNAEFQSFNILNGLGGDFVNGNVTLSNFQESPVGFCQTVDLSLQVHPNTPPGSTHEVNIRLMGACGTDGEYPITFTVPEPPIGLDAAFSYDMEDCSLQLIPVDTDSNTRHEWYVNGILVSSDPSPSVTLGSGPNSIVHTVSNSCVDASSSVEGLLCTQALTCPCEGPNAINIDAGAGALVSTLLSDGTLASNIVLNTCMAIKGRLVVDVPLFGISGGEVKMQPGASIVVNRQRTLVLANINADVDGDGTAGIHGCGQLWEGIIAQSGAFLNPDGSSNFSTGGYLQILNSRLQDAVGAVQLNNRALFRADNNVFDRNHIGILVPPSANGSSFVEMPLGPITQNTFSCSGSLLAPYSGQPTLTNTWGKSGIEVHDCKIFEVGTLQRRNTFTDTERGIYASNSAVRILNATMHDMRSNPYNPADMGLGIGVHAAGRASVELRRSRLYNLETAVFGLEASITGVDNSVGRTPGATPPSGHVGVGFNIKPYRNARTVVDDNFIYARQYGIRVRNAAAAGELRIAAENNITMVTSSSTEIPSGSGAAISLEDGLDASPINRIKVFSNIVTLQQRSDGIALYSVGGAEIFDNEIGFTSSVAAGSKYGIYLQGSNHNYLYGNTVAGAALTGNHHGIYVRGSVGNRLCCNTLNGTSFGMYFDGICDGSRIRHNTFSGNSLEGLTCFLNTRIGSQNEAGNMWIGTFSLWAAAHYSEGEDDVSNSRFFVAPPPGSNVWPANIFAASGIDWFVIGANAQTCATDDNCEVPDELQLIDPDFSIKVARNQFSYGTYPVASQWEAQRVLYRDQKRVAEPVVDTWAEEVKLFFQKQSNENTTLHRLGQLEDDLTNLYANDDDIAHAQAGLHDYSDQLLLLDSLYLDGGMDSLAYFHERSILRGKIGTAFEEISTWVAASYPLRTADVQSLLTENAAFGSEHIAAANQQAVNEYYLQTLAVGLSVLPPTLENKLKDIAEQCPYSGGHAVYRAQSILKIYDKAFAENDCGIQALMGTTQRTDEIRLEATEKAKLSEVSEVIVFPNPSRGVLTVVLPNSEQGWQINLLNLQGQPVRSSIQAAIKCTLDYSGVPPGVYLLQAKSQEKTISKLVVLQ